MNLPVCRPGYHINRAALASCFPEKRDFTSEECRLDSTQGRRNSTLGKV